MPDVLALRDEGRLIVDYVGDYWHILDESTRLLSQAEPYRADGTEHIYAREVPHAGSSGASATRGPRGVYEIMVWSGAGLPGLQAGALVRALVRPRRRWYAELAEAAEQSETAAVAQLTAVQARIAELSAAPADETAEDRTYRLRLLSDVVARKRDLAAARQRAVQERATCTAIALQVYASDDEEFGVEEVMQRYQALPPEGQ